MKHFIMLTVLTAFFSLGVSAQGANVVTGYLVDKMCASAMVKKTPEEAMARAAKHTRECAMEKECAAAGYGVVSDGKWIAFDAAGNQKAAEYLKHTKKADHLKVEVNGTMQDGKLSVTSIRDAKTMTKKVPKTVGA